MTIWDSISDFFSGDGGDKNAALGAYNKGQSAMLTAIGARGAVATQVKNQGGGPYGAIWNSTPVQGTLSALSYVPNQELHALSTAMNVPSIYNSQNNLPQQGGMLVTDNGAWKSFFSAQAWAESWRQTKGQSPGTQAVFNASQGLQGKPVGVSPFLGAQPSEDYQAFTNTWTGRIAGGAIDVAATWYADPILAVGAAAKVSRMGGRVIDPAAANEAVEAASKINSGEVAAQTPAQRAALAARGALPAAVGKATGQTGLFSKAMTEAGQRLFRLVTSTDHLEATDLSKILVVSRRSPEAQSQLVSLFDQASKIRDLDKQRQVKIDILGAAAGSEISRARLIENAPDIAAAQTRLSQAPEGRLALDNIFSTYATHAGASLADTEARSKAIDDALATFGTDANKAELDEYAGALQGIHGQFDDLAKVADNGAMLEKVGLTALDTAKAGIRNYVAQGTYYAPGMGSRGVHVLNWASSQRFRGSIAVDNSELGHQELMDYMRRTKLFEGEEMRAQSQTFLTARTQEARIKQLDNLQSLMIAKVAKARDMEPEAVKDLVDFHRGAVIKSRQYATTELEQARLDGRDMLIVTNPFTGELVSVRRAVLEAHLANNVHLDDPRNIERIVDAHKLDPTAKEALSSDLAAAASNFSSKVDTINHIWRMAVLGRPGLLVRTQIDTQGRNIAMMHGTAYIAQALKAAGRTVTHPVTRNELRGIEASAKTHGLAQDMEDYADVLEQIAYGAEHNQTSIRLPVTTLNARARLLREGVSSESRPALLSDDLMAAEEEMGISHAYSTPVEMLDMSKALRDEASRLRASKRQVLVNKSRGKLRTIDTGNGSIRSTAVEDVTDPVDNALYPGGNHRSGGLLAQPHPNSMQDVFTNVVMGRHQKYVEDASDWKSYDPDHPLQPGAWIRTTDQIRNTYTSRKVLQYGDVSTTDLVRVLMNDPKVAADYRALNEGETRMDWLSRVIDHVAHAAPTAEIRQKLLSEGHLSMKQADELFAKMKRVTDADGNTTFVRVDPNDTRPIRTTIQGPALSPVSQMRRNPAYKPQSMLGRFIRAMSDVPDLKLGRHPLYEFRYFKHLQELTGREFDRHPEWGGIMPPRAQSGLEDAARHRAIQDVQQVHYNTYKYTGAHASLRYVSPFLGAWQDALESWSRLFYDDPGVASGFNKIWQAPNRMGLVVDENGDRVQPGQQADQSYLVLPMELSNNFRESKKVAIRKESLNSIFQGAQWYTPGTGPVVQIPMQEIVARNFPEFGASNNPLVRTLLPFGTPKVRPGIKGFGEDIFDGMSPSWTRALYSAWSGTDNLYAYQASVNQQIIQARLAKKPIPSAATLDRVARGQARNAGFFKAASLGLFGFSGKGSNVADFYKQQYDLLSQHQAEFQAQGKSVSEVFAEQFPEAAGLSFGLTKSDTGITATLKAFDASQKYAKEINQPNHKQYGWFYIGAENVGGDFSQTAYNAQFSRGERTPQSRDELLNNSLAQDGWNKYQQFMQKVDNRLVELGLHDLNQAGAQLLQDKRSEFVAQLSQENPAWAQDFNSDNGNTLQQFLDNAALPALDDPKLKDRSDMVLLAQYLALRDQALQRLQAAGLKSLSAGAAQNLRALLNTAGTEMARQDFGFQQLWNRQLQKEVLPTHAETLLAREAAS